MKIILDKHEIAQAIADYAVKKHFEDRRMEVSVTMRYNILSEECTAECEEVK